MHKIHSMLAEDSPWTRSATEDLHWSSGTSSCSIHRSGLLNHRRKLILHIIDDTTSDGLFDLLAEDSPLIFVVLQAHLSDFIGNTLVFEVLQCPSKTMKI